MTGIIAGTTPPEIVHLYSAKEAYGLTDMKPATWEQLLYRSASARLYHQFWQKNLVR